MAFDAQNKRKIFLDAEKQSINNDALKRQHGKYSALTKKCFHGNKKVIKFCSKHAVWLQFQFSWQILCKTSHQA